MRHLLRSFVAAGFAAALLATPALADDEQPFRKRGRQAKARHEAPQRFQQRGPGAHRRQALQARRFQRGRAPQRMHRFRPQGRRGALAAQRRRAPMQGRLMQAFARIDRNGDGVIDRREFAAMARAKARGFGGRGHAQRAPDRRRGFEARARRGAGRGPAARDRAPARRRGAQADVRQRRTKARGAAILYRLREADADGDGTLSRAEAPALLKKHFARLDRDEDGFLDKAELKAAVKRLARGDGAPGEARQKARRKAPQKARKKAGKKAGEKRKGRKNR